MPCTLQRSLYCKPASLHDYVYVLVFELLLSSHYDLVLHARHVLLAVLLSYNLDLQRKTIYLGSLLTYYTLHKEVVGKLILEGQIVNRNFLIKSKYSSV